MVKNKNNLYLLTQDFYDEHSHLVEIMKKNNRPYFIYNITIDEIEFALPLRSDIRHNNFFCTGKTETGEICGIDYSKAIILINKDKYVKDTNVWIRKEEYKELRGNEHIILKEFKQYIKAYIKAYVIISQKKGSKKEKSLCLFSTLQNYHKELNILSLDIIKKN